MGIRIALASGRPLPGLFHARDLLKLNEHHGMLVAYNGGKVEILLQMKFYMISTSKMISQWSF